MGLPARYYCRDSKGDRDHQPRYQGHNKEYEPNFRPKMPEGDTAVDWHRSQTDDQHHHVERHSDNDGPTVREDVSPYGGDEREEHPDREEQQQDS